jgi:hypothetical protein
LLPKNAKNREFNFGRDRGRRSRHGRLVRLGTTPFNEYFRHRSRPSTNFFVILGRRQLRLANRPSLREPEDVDRQDLALKCVWN